MRHLKAGRKLNRSASHRHAMLRNLVTSLIEHGRVRTTDAKAKEVRRFAERMVTLGKKSTVEARRRARRFVRTDAALKRLFEELAPGYADRNGGYTRIVKLGVRRGDAAPVSIIEFVDRAATAVPSETPATEG